MLESSSILTKKIFFCPAIGGGAGPPLSTPVRGAETMKGALPEFSGEGHTGPAENATERNNYCLNKMASKPANVWLLLTHSANFILTLVSQSRKKNSGEAVLRPVVCCVELHLLPSTPSFSYATVCVEPFIQITRKGLTPSAPRAFFVSATSSEF